MTTLLRLLVPLTLLISVACGGNPVATDSPDSTPAWLASLIRESETQPVANPPAVITSYEYQGQTVYFVPQRCCDVMSVLYRDDGSIACHPNGGFSGAGDGRCADFFRERRRERIIWRDTRAAP